jgi:hypothetical protein
MGDELHPPKSDALKALYWRSEILQVMYWLRGEGLGDVIDAELLERFLGVGADVGLGYLERLVVEGYVDRSDHGFTLARKGLEEGATEFAMSFVELTRPAHGDCSADCWCHASVDEAVACAADRTGHRHQ